MIHVCIIPRTTFGGCLRVWRPGQPKRCNSVVELYPTPPSIAPFSPHTKLLIRSYGAENAASKIGCVNHKPSAEALGLDILPLLGGGCCKSRRGRGSEPLRSHPFAPKAGAKDGAPRFLRVESQQTHTAKPARVGHSALHMHGISMPASALLASLDSHVS